MRCLTKMKNHEIKKELKLSNVKRRNLDQHHIAYCKRFDADVCGAPCPNGEPVFELSNIYISLLIFFWLAKNRFVSTTAAAGRESEKITSQ